MGSEMQITITRPDDWHLHLRDGQALASLLPYSARQFARAIVMPNLRPPVTDVASAAQYRERILAAVPVGMSFEPLMTLYLTDKTPADEIRRAVESGFVKAVKLYPAGATTNSDAGVTDLARCDAALAEMERLGLPLLMHGEVTDPDVDIFDRENVFIETVLQPLLARRPGLRRCSRVAPVCVWCSNTLRPGMRPSLLQRPARMWPRQLPRITCCTTGMPCLLVVCGRITIACPC